jgi:hypothetical protein
MHLRTLPSLAALAFSVYGTAVAAAPVASGPRITAHPQAPAVELDIQHKRHLGTPQGVVFTEAWGAALKACADRGGYVTEYRDGATRPYVDTRENAQRVNAYLTCSLQRHAGDDDMQLQVVPDVHLIAGTGANDAPAWVEAEGHPRAAYRAVLNRAYETCMASGQRVGTASVAFIEQPGDRPLKVSARFACTATASP